MRFAELSFELSLVVSKGRRLPYTATVRPRIGMTLGYHMRIRLTIQATLIQRLTNDEAYGEGLSKHDIWILEMGSTQLC